MVINNKYMQLHKHTYTRSHSHRHAQSIIVAQGEL